MADNFDNYSMKVQARVDMPSNKDIDAQIRKLEKSISKLKVSGQFDDTALKNLTNQLNSLKSTISTANFSPTALTELTNQVNRALQNINIGNINVGNVSNQAQQVGQRIGNAISQGIINSTNGTSQVTDKILRDFSELNEAKRQFVDEHGLISKDDIADANKFYQTVREAFKEFGQVTISKGEMTDGGLENLRVKIQQVNGELKTTREFMLYLNKSDQYGKQFKLVDDDTIKTTERMVQHLNEAKNITNVTGDEANALKQKLADQSKYYGNIKQEVNTLYSLKTKLLSADELETAELERQIKSTKQRITYNNQQIDKKGLRDNSLTREVNDLEVAKQKQLALAEVRLQDSTNAKSQAQSQKELNAALKEQQSLASQANKIQLSMGVNGDTTSKIEVLRNNFTKLGLSADEVKTKMSGVDTEVKTLQSLMNSGADNSAIVTQFEKLQTVLTQTQNNLKQTRSDYSLLATEQQRLSLANTIEAWNQKNTRATKEVRAENDRYVASLRDLNNQMTKLQFGQIQTGFKQTENSMRTLDRLGASLKDQIKQAANSFTQWISVSSAIMGVVYSTKQAVSELKEVDNILTEISKTSDMTSQELEKLGMSSYSSASKYGRTATDYLTGVQEMSRSGFYGDKGTAMAEQSLLAQSAGDMTSELANSYILATNAAFKYNGEASKINEVLDGQNSITNKNSVAMADMATAMTKAGTVASSYNVSIEDLSAMIGTMESVTKLGGEEIGTGIKSLLINLQNISSSKITGTLDKANASMTEMKNGIEQLRNPIEILRDLAKTFNDLDEKDPLRAEILTSIGGKYQATKLAALLQNMDMYDKMLVDYSQGSGSAMEEASKSANNLQGRLNALSNSWTEFVNSVVQSDTLKTGVNILNELVQGVTKLTSSLGSLGTIGLGAGLLASFKGAG